MSIGSLIFATGYDRFMRSTERAGLSAHRATLVAGASGDVVEIGGGTGANLTVYGPAVRSLTICEPEPPMFRRLQQRATRTGVPATVMRAAAEDLPFNDSDFDVAVSTLVLCSVDDQPRALRELRRVLRPGGRLLFLEHVRADNESLSRMQDRMNWLNRLVAHCDCNRPTLETIKAAGFVVDDVIVTELPKTPPFVRPLIIGSATSPARARETQPAGPTRS